jgi:AcrR family transcriptional regulator
MSIANRTDHQNAIATSAATGRKPQQERSVASLERMLDAVAQLMIQRGNEDFTLQEVSQSGNVSIGSIYLRFEGKDSLVRAVIGTALERLAEEEDRVVSGANASAKTLAQFVPAYVHAYAEILRHHAPLLRLIMERAAYDPFVSARGKARARRAAEQASAALLSYVDEFGGINRELKANCAHHIVFAALVRELSLGSRGESAEHLAASVKVV